MLDEYKDDKQQASIYFQLFKLTGRQEHRAKALALLRDLQQRQPGAEIKKMLAELEEYRGTQ
ncbi:hypothetical protein HY768_10405 [candidate division TA06 bacterium]|uniref:Tetratricopeptide repeat protein n=1 Tax=candidate division TA06 bacterium TaxID=2250710 RepID=A0A933ML31_UNCT6|nr:hypothetical protein [candidate division TA06 bacterium]